MPAFKNANQAFSAIANEDMSSTQYRMVVVTSGSDTTVNIASVADQVIFGAVQNKPNSGQHATVDFMGITKVRAGIAINAGLPITGNATGFGVLETSSGGNRFGYSLTGCLSGGICTVMIDRSYI